MKAFFLIMGGFVLVLVATLLLSVGGRLCLYGRRTWVTTDEKCWRECVFASSGSAFGDATWRARVCALELGCGYLINGCGEMER